MGALGNPDEKNLFFPGQGAKFSFKIKKKAIFVLEKIAKLRVVMEACDLE
jgi:hypothetical protein